MKAGVVAAVIALKALFALGYAPAAKVILESVLEEECTGNGALACLARYVNVLHYKKQNQKNQKNLGGTKNS
jgi:acetylornithine deacetylase/succinyl-diaminopimelate desuccinylase-like protein